MKTAIVKSMAEMAQSLPIHHFYHLFIDSVLFARWRHYFPRLIQINYGMIFRMICAKFGKDLFNVYKVIGRTTKMAPVFLAYPVSYRIVRLIMMTVTTRIKLLWKLLHLELDTQCSVGRQCLARARLTGWLLCAPLKATRGSCCP